MSLLNYELKEQFILKINQFSDTLQIRLGIMIVGATGSGKTTIYTII